MGGFRSVSLLSISTTIALFFALISLASTSGLNQSVILVSFDGLGWEFVGSKRTNTPNFDFFVSGGVKAKNLIGVHPVKTFPAHTTFLTGLYPESHGIVDNKFWDPLYMEKFILEHDCSNFDPKFYNESEPIWLTMQKQGIRTGAYYWPGSTSHSTKPTFYAEPFCYLRCDDYKGPMLEYLRLYLKVHCFFNWAKPFQKRIDTVLEWLSSENPPRLVMLYFEQPDMEGHKNGPNSAGYAQKIEDIDREVLGYLVERLMRLQLMDKTNVVILSDHGIVETKDTRQIRINDYIDPDSYFRKVAAQEHIWPKPGKLEEIYAKLKSAQNPHLKVYKKEEIPEEYHWKNNRRIPPIYLVAEEGWLMRQDYNPLAEGKWVEGTHGWPPTEKSAGIFYARGPAFKEGYTSSKSKRAIDVYELLCYLVGTKPLPNNGSLDNMMEFLKKPPAANHERKPVTTITSHTVFTPAITNHTSKVASQTKTENNQWYTKGNQTRQDSNNFHADITTSIPLNQRTTNKERRQRSSFILQTPAPHQTEVNGNNLDHKCRISPQNSIKVIPTVTKMTNKLRLTSVLPQVNSISAVGDIVSAMGSIDVNTLLTQDNVVGKTTITSGNLNATHENQKEKTTVLSTRPTLASKMSIWSSDLIQRDLVQSSSFSTLDSQLGDISTRTLTDSINSTPVLPDTPFATSDLQSLNTASTGTTSKDTASTSTTRVLKDSRNTKTTLSLLDTPFVTSDLQHFTKTSTKTTSTDSYVPSVTKVDTPIISEESKETLLSIQQRPSAPLDAAAISRSDVRPAMMNDMLTTTIESDGSLSTVTHTPMNTNTHSSKNVHRIKEATPLWNSDAQSVESTATLKTSTATDNVQFTSRGTHFATTTAESLMTASTSTTTTGINLITSLAPLDTSRVNLKTVSEEKEPGLDTNTPNLISASLTRHSDLADTSVDSAKHENTVTRTEKELLLKTTDSDALVKEYTTSLPQQQATSSGAVAETTLTRENTLGEKVLTTKQSGVLTISSMQVQTSVASSSSAINLNNTTSNFTSSNMSVAVNSSMGNETTSGEDGEDGVNTDCPPLDGEEEYGQDDEYSETSNTRSSATVIIKRFSYLEAILILMMAKLNSWLGMQ